MFHINSHILQSRRKYPIFRLHWYFSLLLLHFLFFPNLLCSQSFYPVYVQVNLIPPYSLYLDDYAGGFRERLSVTLLNRDLQYPNMTVRLRITIKANGFTLQTVPYAAVSPIQLSPNQPYKLTPEELGMYFQPHHLSGGGMGGRAFRRERRLPEGPVEMCVEVLEHFTGRLLSQSTCGMAWLAVQQPPYLNLPADKQPVEFRDPLNLFFQWTPRHTGLGGIEYEFILKQLYDEGMAPEAAFAYSPEIFRVPVSTSSLFYGSSCPPLQPGARYAWAIRATAKDQGDDIRVFANNGLSEIRTFTLSEYCPPPVNIKAEAERQKGRIVFTWSPLPVHSGFTLGYRPKEIVNSEWFYTHTALSEHVVYNVRPKYTYEYKIGSECSPNKLPLFDEHIRMVYLPERDTTMPANCGVGPNIDLSNKEPLPGLVPGDVFIVYDFPMHVLTCEGSNGVFSGTGYTFMPAMFHHAKIRVHWTNITINTDYRMIAGKVEAVRSERSQLAALDDIFEGGGATGAVGSGITSVDATLDFVIPDNAIFMVIPSMGEISVTNPMGLPGMNPDGYFSYATTSSSDSESTPIIKLPMTVVDREGRIYELTEGTDPTNPHQLVANKIGSQGQPLSAGSVDYTTLSQALATVTFHQEEGSTYAFDQWISAYAGSPLIEEKYEKLQDYRVPFKLLPAGKTDKVSATIDIKDERIDAAKVIFQTSKGTTFHSVFDETTSRYTITLTGGKPDDGQELYALYPNGERHEVFGKLIILTYKEYHYTTVAVPINGATVDTKQLEHTLNTIYHPAGIRWTVEESPAFTYSGTTDFFETGSGLLSAYTDNMQAFQESYSQSNSIATDKTYLFFFEQAHAGGVKDRNTSGFMPRNKQFAYLFTQGFANEAQLYTAVAHELAHGQLSLEHTFDNDYQLTQGVTDNLMDYSGGTHLAKWQWDLINDPGLVMRIFERDEEGMKSWTIIDKKYTQLFNHVYEKNLEPYNTAHTTAYQTKDWDKAWTYGDSKPEELVDKVLDKIKGTGEGVTIPKITLRDNGIYVGKHKVGDKEYAAAIYSRKGEISNIKKVKIVELRELKTDSIRKYLYCESTYQKYLVLAFYEEGETEPSLMLQAAKNELELFSDKHLEAWMKYVGVMEEKGTEDTKDFEIQLFDGDKRSGRDSIMSITAEPKMPVIRAKIVSQIKGTYKVKLEIKYLRQCTGNGVTRTPNQTTSFPSTGWHEVNEGTEWDINFGTDTETQRPMIRGGIAYLIAESPSGERDTTRFFIKGTNPTVTQLNNYLNQAPYNQVWFFKKIIFHESGTPNNLTALVRQFNPYDQNQENLSETNWDALSRMPNFGAPCGWGLGQLDNPAPPEQALWDWQANIMTAYDLLMEKQGIVDNHLTSCNNIVTGWNKPGRPIVTQADRTEGGITYSHAPSPSFNHAINTHFDGALTNNRRSFIDACWMKLYNGLGSERQHYYWLAPSNSNNPPRWNITDVATSGIYTNYYVREVSQRATP